MFSIPFFNYKVKKSFLFQFQTTHSTNNCRMTTQRGETTRTWPMTPVSHDSLSGRDVNVRPTSSGPHPPRLPLTVDNSSTRHDRRPLSTWRSSPPSSTRSSSPCLCSRGPSVPHFPTSPRRPPRTRMNEKITTVFVGRNEVPPVRTITGIWDPVTQDTGREW